MSTQTQAYKCNHTQPSINISSSKEMAHLSWDIPNKLISLLKKLSAQGLAWDLVWSSWRGTLKRSQLPWKRGVWEGTLRTAVLSCVLLGCLHCIPFTTMDSPLSWDFEDGDGTGKDDWEKETNKRNCLSNWGFWITSRLVITLEIYGVHFFLCKLIYKYWSGLSGCFLRKHVNYYCLYPGNLLTILNTIKKPTLFHLSHLQNELGQTC